MNRTHLSGIIPIAGLQTNHNLMTPEVMTPIAPGFTAIQKSVFECAIAGCNTIWIVANEDLAPVIRKTVGEWVYDPVYYDRMKYGQGSDNRREIPIYYVPIDVKDRNRRDSYGWSILNGIYASWRTANHISKWIVPNKYFISFPMSVFDIYQIRSNRRLISDKNTNFFTSYNNQTVIDNLPLSFAITGQDYINCRKDVNQQTTKEFYNTTAEEKYPSRRLPLKERWSARHFNLSEVFRKLNISDSNIFNIDWYYDISDWQQYRSFLGSNKIIKKPHDVLTKPRTHAKIPYTIEEGSYESD